MVHYVLPSETSYNFTTGLDVSFQYLTSQIPQLPSWLLTALFLIIMLGGYMGTKRTEGRNQFLLWWTVAGFITTIVAYLMFLIPVVTLTIVVVFLMLTVVGAVMYFASGIL